MNKVPSLILLSIVICLAAIVLLALWSLAFGYALVLLLGPDWAETLSFLGIVAFMLLPWNRFHTRSPYAICGRIIIGASPHAVWNAIELRARDDYYAPILNRVEDLGEGRFAFSSDIDGIPNPRVEMQVTDVSPAEYLRYRPVDATQLPLWGKDLRSSEFTLIRLPGGETEVQQVERLCCLRLSSFLSLLFLNPVQDGLKALKAHCEGSEDMAWMSGEARAMRAGEATPMDRAGLVIGGTMAATVMTIAFGLIYWALA